MSKSSREELINKIKEDDLQRGSKKPNSSATKKVEKTKLDAQIDELTKKTSIMNESYSPTVKLGESENNNAKKSVKANKSVNNSNQSNADSELIQSNNVSDDTEEVVTVVAPRQKRKQLLAIVLLILWLLVCGYLIIYLLLLRDNYDAHIYLDSDDEVVCYVNNKNISEFYLPNELIGGRYAERGLLLSVALQLPLNVEYEVKFKVECTYGSNVIANLFTNSSVENWIFNSDDNYYYLDSTINPSTITLQQDGERLELFAYIFLSNIEQEYYLNQLGLNIYIIASRV